MKKLLASLKNVKRSVLVLLCGAGIGIGLLLSLPAVEAIHAMSSNEFCGSCHTMEPMVETFAQSVHGGNNSQGFVAECVDCHLPKSNVVEELWVKGTSGTRHLWGEYAKGMTALDYEKNHNNRHEFVYDSGCLNCHKGLESRAVKATQASPIADQTHKLAFEKKGADKDWQCSSCHYDIAHPNLKWEMRERMYEEKRKLAKQAKAE